VDHSHTEYCFILDGSTSEGTYRGSASELLLTEDRLEDLQFAERENKNAIPALSAQLAADEEIIENLALHALIGIYFNLITKKLTLQNINQWYKQRAKAYTKGI